ncbi:MULTISPECIES: hypothetical protein [unclassified Clostridium]|uniref:hypothetical protein n=1 Tax=unclassified Clostridium TaxID=2614128 RepID=UPI0025B7C302|nr:MULTISPECIES: hypothetical protein [unclassified Clostridium]
MILKILCFLLFLFAVKSLINILKDIKNVKSKTKVYIIEGALDIVTVLSLLIGSFLYIIVNRFSFNHIFYIVCAIAILSNLIKLSIELLCKKSNSKHYVLQNTLNILLGVLFIFDKVLNVYYNKCNFHLDTIMFFLAIAKIYVYLIFGGDEINNE